MKLVKRSSLSLFVAKPRIQICSKRNSIHAFDLLARYESSFYRYFGTVAEVRQTLLDKLENDLGIKSSEQWYQYTCTKLKDHPDGMKLMSKYRNSVHTMLSELRPKVNWMPWMFSHVPVDFWNNSENINSYMRWIQDELHIAQPSDWYRFTAHHIAERHGKGLLNKFDGSLHQLLLFVYPSFDWKPWLFASIPKELWNSLETKIRFAKHLEKELQFQALEDWYRITPEDFSKHGGASLLKEYNGSIVPYLQEVHPEKQWNDWEFQYKQRLRSFWTQENARRYFDRLGSKLGISNMEDWHKVTEQHLNKNGGKSLLKKFNGSFYNLLCWVFPEHSWKRHKFMKGDTKRYSWEDENVVLQFMESVKSDLGVKEMSDWYKVTVRDLRAVGARGLLAHHGESLFSILRTIYPKYDWKPWMFRVAPRNFWTTEASVKEYIKWLETQLGISAMEDWYNVSATEIANFYYGATILAKRGGLGNLLKSVYPDFEWNLELFEQGNQFKPSKAQIRLFAAVQKIFAGEKVLMDVKHPDLPQQYELDIYLPNLKLALEYQGEHHYFDHYMFGSVKVFQRRDTQKQRLCKLKGISMVYVPYWWNRSESRATIAERRPDLNLLDPIVHRGIKLASIERRVDELDAVPIPQTPPCKPARQKTPPTHPSNVSL